MPPEPRPARTSRVRAPRAPAQAWPGCAVVLALAWIVAAGGATPAAAQATQPAPAAPAEPPAVPDARPGEVALRLAATGGLDAGLSRQWPADDAHLCAALTLAGGRQDYLLRFGADPAASVLDAAHPGLVLTVSGLDDAPARLAPRTGSVQVAIGGQTFFGSTQPGAPFRLELSVLDDGEGGRFVAHHLADRSGQQVIDLAGAWRCPAAPTAVAAARPAEPAPDSPAALPPAAAGIADAAPPAVAPTPAVTPPVAPPPPAALPPVAAVPPPPAPLADAPAAPALPPGTAFRELLTNLDHAAPPAPALSSDAPEAAPVFTPVPPLPAVAVASPALSGRKVFIHIRAGSRRGLDVADDLSRTLDPQFAHTEIRTVRVTPGDAEVRFSHPEDAAAAHALARRLGRAWHVRSFTDMANRTQPGSLEVWVPER